MDFELSTDQVALQEAIRKQLDAQYPMAVVRSLEASGGVDRVRWRQLGDAGVFALRLPETDGGVGLGSAEAVLVFEELGRALVPGPLVASHLASGLVDGAAGGEAIVGVLERTGDGHGLLVEHLAALDVLVVVDADGVFVVQPEALDVEPVPTPLDPLTPLHRVRSLPAGSALGGADLAARWRRDGAVLVASLQLGIAEAVTDAAVAYAKERVQFDKPIGAFQAVKHLLADMLVRTEMARAAVYAAGVTLDDPEVGDPDRAAAVAKIMAGEAALANGKACIQVHGGMGFTWEVDSHLYLKRAWVLDSLFGPVDRHAEALAAAL
jgi:alkylation response protein AidB-like acyl-CoA dehydrogenase